MYLLGLILSAVIGLSLGLIGGGGSILTVPILVYFLGVEPHEAVAMSLAVVGATSLFGSYLHWKRGSVNFSSGLLFGVSGIAGAFLGSPLTHTVSPPVLLLIFGALVLFGGLAMKEAIGTSLFVIFLNCVAGLIGHVSQGAFDWSLTFLVMALAVGGAVFGTILSYRLAAHRLQKMFAMLVLVVAVFLFAKNYAVLF